MGEYTSHVIEWTRGNTLGGTSGAISPAQASSPPEQQAICHSHLPVAVGGSILFLASYGTEERTTDDSREGLPPEIHALGERAAGCAHISRELCGRPPGRDASALAIRLVASFRRPRPSLVAWLAGLALDCRQTPIWSFDLQSQHETGRHEGWCRGRESNPHGSHGRAIRATTIQIGLGSRRLSYGPSSGQVLGG